MVPSDFRPEVKHRFAHAHEKMTVSVIMNLAVWQIPRSTERISGSSVLASVLLTVKSLEVLHS